MNHLRLYKKNILFTKIRELERNIKYHENNIQNIQQSPFPDSYKLSQITFSTDSINQYKEEKEKINREITEIEEGNQDDTIQIDIKKTEDKIQAKHNKTVDKKKNETIKKKEGEKRMLDVRQEERKEDKKGYRLKKEIDYEFKKYYYLCESIPNYITNNLETMPNNKGYIYRGLYLYGKQDKDNNDTITLFEKPNKDVLLIHEWRGNTFTKYEKVYSKNKNSGKKIIERYTRVIKDSPNLLDYVKI